MRPQKYIEVADRLAARIRRGDYHLHELPAERELAVEAGVSYTTARKAVQHLVEQGILHRLANGRASPPPAGTGGTQDAPAQVALLTPAWISSTLAGWRRALAQASASRKVSVRTVLYTHWDDPALATTLQGFDGAFLIPEPEAPPAEVVALLRDCGKPVVVLDADWSLHGLRSVKMNPPFFAHRLLDHLASLGHRTIDYLNVQPDHEDFLAPWRLWIAAQGLRGDCIDAPVRPYEDTLPAAYAVVDRMLSEGTFRADALFCATESAACGAMAALVDHGRQPGRDVGVCTADSGARAALANPSLTSMADLDREPYAALCLDWMAGRSERGWPGPLLLQPDDCRVVIRQSTVPAVVETRRLD